MTHLGLFSNVTIYSQSECSKIFHLEHMTLLEDVTLLRFLKSQKSNETTLKNSGLLVLGMLLETQHSTWRSPEKSIHSY